MLEAYLSFAGPTGQLLNYLGNCDAIQAPIITRTGVGQYRVTFLTARKIDATKIASSIISVECQSPSGTLTFTNVIPSPVSVFNANASSGFTYQVSFQIEVQQLVIVLLLITATGFVDRPEVMVSIVAKNQEPGLSVVGATDLFYSAYGYYPDKTATLATQANPEPVRALAAANEAAKAEKKSNPVDPAILAGIVAGVDTVALLGTKRDRSDDYTGNFFKYSDKLKAQPGLFDKVRY